MSEYVIPGGYNKSDAEFIRKKLLDSAKIIFDKNACINVTIAPIFASGNGIIFENEDYGITISSDNCVNDSVLKTWATEEIVVGYCRAAAREHGVL